MKLAFDIAVRFLKSNKGQTLLIVIGIVIGVAVQVFVGSLIEGLQVSLVDGTIGSSSHVTIVAEDTGETFSQEAVTAEELKEDERLTAVSESLSQNGFILEDEENTYAVFLRGFRLEDADDIYDFEGALVEGKMPASENEVLVGIDFKEELDVAPGESLDFISTSNEVDQLEIVGVFDLGVSSLNESWVVTDLQTAQILFGEEEQLSNIEMQVVDVFEADALAAEIEEQVAGQELTTTNWKEENESLLSGLTGQSISSYMIQFFVLIAVLLGIASVLAISGVQKSKQLGILKAMGIKDRTAGLIFLVQGFILGMIGALIGALLGIGIMYVFSIFVQNPDGSPLVPFCVDPVFVTISVVIAIISSTIAAYIPAKNSSKLNPIEVIQNG
jgi:lipoprotein-releasing system permease protein